MTPEPGWYPDPFDPTQDRWWNGLAWTENTQAGPQSPDPYAEARAEPTPAGGDYVSELADDGTSLPDYEILASVEEGAKQPSSNSFPGVPAPPPPMPTAVGQGTPVTAANEWDEGSDSDKRGGKRRLAKILGIGGIVLALLLVSGTAAAYFLLNGRGPQVEDILPSNTAFMARIDLDPSLEQKANVLRLLSRFPQFENTNTGEGQDPQSAILDALSDESTDQELLTDAKTWLGSRIGVGLVPVGSDEYSPVVVASVKDEAALDTFMKKHAAENYYAIKDGYAVISETQGTVTSVLETQETLGSSASFQQARERMGLDAIALLWSDAGQAQKLQESLAGNPLGVNPLGPVSDSDFSASGYIMLGVAAEPDAVRVAAVTESLTASDAPIVDLSPTGDGISGLPSETLAAVSLANPGKILDEIIKAVEADEPDFGNQLDAGLAEFDLGREAALGFLGTQFSVIALPQAGSDEPMLALAIQGQNIADEDKKRILGLVNESVGGFGVLPSEGQITTVEADGTTYVVAEKLAVQLQEYLDSAGTLSETEDYKRAFPAGSNGLVSGFISATGFETAQEASDQDFFSQVMSLGFTVQVDPEARGSSRTEFVLAFK